MEVDFLKNNAIKTTKYENIEPSPLARIEGVKDKVYISHTCAEEGVVLSISHQFPCWFTTAYIYESQIP